MAEVLFNEDKPENKPKGKITYNLEMAKAIRKIKPPYKNFKVDVKAMPEWLALVIYEDEILEFSVDQRVNIMEYLMMMRDVIQSYGVRCELEGRKYARKKL